MHTRNLLNTPNPKETGVGNSVRFDHLKIIIFTTLAVGIDVIAQIIETGKQAVLIQSAFVIRERVSSAEKSQPQWRAESVHIAIVAEEAKAFLDSVERTRNANDFIC